MENFISIFWDSTFMKVNAIVSIVAIWFIAERAYVLFYKYQVNSKQFMMDVENLVKQGNISQAINHCSTSTAPLATVVKSGLTKAPQGPMAVSMGLDEATLEVAPKVQKRVGSLWGIANIATLVGLIGTIIGLIVSFSGLSVATPEQRATLLGQGIAEALYNTALGLTIAVTCIIAHSFLSGLAKDVMSDIDYYSSRLENLLMAHAKGTMK
ncbi:MAG: MotA/TolQ/ExbB proton channel family protein [Bdellovibrionales bacterium]|nr:MotA/TolQ/ExbB proton channel family protein [Bdellovibrionales bacterium]